MRKAIVTFILLVFFSCSASAIEKEDEIVKLVGKTLNEVKSLGKLRENHDFEDEDGDTYKDTAWYLELPSKNEIYLLSKGNRIWSIFVDDPRFKTKRNIGVGNTMGEVLTRYPGVIVIDSFHYARYEKIKFYFDTRKISYDQRTGKKIFKTSDNIIQNLKVTMVIFSEK